MVDEALRAKKEDQARKALAKARDAQERAKKATTDEARKDAENEAQAFFAAAGHLMWKYGLDQAALEREESGGRNTVSVSVIWFDIPSGGGHGPERVHAVHTVLTQFDCDTVSYGCKRLTKGKPIKMKVFGPDDVLPDIKIIVPALLLQIEEAGKQAAKRERGMWDPYCYTPSEINTRVTKYRRSFMQGFGAGVARRLAERRQQTEAEIKGSGAELVLLDRKARVGQVMSAEHPDGKRLRVPNRDADAFRAGVHAGYYADLGNRSLEDEKLELTS